MYPSVVIGLLTLVLIPATICDVKYYRIPNSLSLMGCVLGVLFATLFSNLSGFLYSLAGLSTAFCLGLPFWLLGWMGAGDVKLVTATGAIVGFPDILTVLTGIAVAGFFLALGMLIARGMACDFLQRCRDSFNLSFATRNFVLIQPSEAGQLVKLPYAIAITAGTAISYVVFCL